VTVSALPPQFQAAVRRVCDILTAHHSFLIVGHVRPDGDCIGSQIGLGLGLLSLGKQVRIYSPGPVMRHFKFVPRFDLLETALDMSFQPDVTVFVDCGGADRAGSDFVAHGKIVNIDHHVSNDGFGDAAYVNTGATAAGEMVFDVLRELGAQVTPDIAKCLYLAIMADTGSFRYSNTSARTFEVAQELVRHGADPAWVAAGFYDNMQGGSLWLKGQVLSHLHFECDGRLCWAEITQEMYDRAGGETNEPEGLVSELRSVEGIEVSILIHEVSGGGARAGIRSRGTWDVNLIATELGGGGHRNASGCYIEGNYPEIRDRILEVARDHLSRPAAAQRQRAG
jgi:phosphoesterase RecJ-like protein